MKRSVLRRSLIMPLLFILPAGLVQAAKPIMPQETMPMQRAGKIIAQLPNFPSKPLQLPKFNPKYNDFKFKNGELADVLTKVFENEEENEESQYWKNYLKETLLWLFKPEDVCINEEEAKQNKKNCKLSAPARKWLKEQIKSMENGVCEGMATASLYLWLAKNHPDVYKKRTEFYTDVDELSKKSASSFKKNNRKIQEYITNLFILQSIDRVEDATLKIRNNKKPSEILDMLIESIKSNPEDPYTMGIYQRKNFQLTEGHSLTPFAVEDMGEQIYRVHVYDSNFPGETQYVEFNKNQETWYYQPHKSAKSFVGNDKTKNLDLTKLSLRDLPKDEYFDCPFCQEDKPSQENLEISLIGEGEMSITDDKGEEVKANVVPFKGGLNRRVPPTYNVTYNPKNVKFYKITLTGKDTDRNFGAELVIAGFDYTIGVENIDLEPEEHLEIYIIPDPANPQLTFDVSKQEESPTLFIDLEDDKNDRSYSFNISGVTVANEKAVVLGADIKQKRIYFGDTDGQKDSYNLAVEYIDKDNSYELEVEDIPLAGQDFAFFDLDEWKQKFGNNVEVPISFYTPQPENEDQPIDLQEGKSDTQPRVWRGDGRAKP